MYEYYVAADTGYNFCGYKTQPADPETSEQFKSLNMDDNYTVNPMYINHKRYQRAYKS